MLSSLCLPSVCCSLFCPGDRELQVPWGRMCRPQYMYLSRKTGLLNSPRPLGAMESGPIKSNDIVQRLVACLCALGRAQKLGSKDLAEERKKNDHPCRDGVDDSGTDTAQALDEAKPGDDGQRPSSAL